MYIDRGSGGKYLYLQSHCSLTPSIDSCGELQAPHPGHLVPSFKGVKSETWWTGPTLENLMYGWKHLDCSY